jgi:hypothetical protein
MEISDIAEMIDLYADQAFDAGAAEERQNIIQLLEDNNTCDGGISTGTCFCEAINFLKGEN